MLNNIKPIQTSYKGYRFRSRLEARWAVFFDALGIRWEYEPEGFELGHGERYLPDFKLTCPRVTWWPDAGFWVEIKAFEPTQRELKNLADVSVATKKHGLLFVGLPGQNHYYETRLESGVAAKTGAPIEAIRGGTFTIEPPHYLACRMIEFTDHDDTWPQPVWRAMDKARSARFEFGESGA